MLTSVASLVALVVGLGVAAERPNVVLVIGCTVRRDQLGAYGGPAGVTPFLDALAARGAVFADAVTASPWTRPSHVALLTGEHPAVIGMTEAGPGTNNRRLAPEVDTLAEHLAAGGYRTLGVTANPNLNRIWGMAQGFAAYHEGSVLWRERRGAVKPAGVDIVAAALELLDTDPAPGVSGDPFYLQLTLIDPHGPYPVDPKEIAPFDEPDLPPHVAPYRAGLHVFDAAVATLAAGLEARGFDDEDTLFLVVSDHGEGLDWPAHHRLRHGRELFASVTAMPWIVTGPGVAEQSIGGLASQVDVTPTVLGFVGLPPPDGPGQDWSAQLRGTSPDTTRGTAFAHTTFSDVDQAAVFTQEVACAVQRSAPEKKLPTRPLPHCYDRRAQPDATELLAAPPAALLQVAADWHAAMAAAATAWPHTANADPDADITELLGELGYIQE